MENRSYASLTSFYQPVTYNPGQIPPGYSFHYARAYAQSLTGPGYASSSTHDPSTAAATLGYHAVHNRSLNNQNSAWYQPGNSRCTYKSCSFTGSPKALEIHRMDRHLIYPPGWSNQKKRQDWDADPSLKGKPIPIQGTTLVLDTPEVLEAWVAERKKRWPTSSRVDEKKRKMDEAIARGQLSMEHFNKRRKIHDNATEAHDGGEVRSGNRRGRGKGRGTGRGGGQDSGWRGRGRGGAVAGQSRNVPSALQSFQNPDDIDFSTSDDDDDQPPEIISSKPLLVTEILQPQVDGGSDNDDSGDESEKQRASSAKHILKPTKRPPHIQPKHPPRNPFASRSTLLRSLLRPEIQMTVSNLSQAIRFLVDNQFLESVELKPGDGKMMIEVVDNN